MRFAAYAGASMVLATAVIARAMHERANLYSASVYIAQSNACLMVLTNVALLAVCTGMLGLQRIFYGALRPIEVEQLYEKAWFAITETCLAMTIFREEVGGWFLVMFICLLIGKVWGWIGEGRVDILEQQPPSNPRLFHARLSVSLIVSVVFDTFMLRYSVYTVLHHARPNMMVMFAFEFAVLTVSSLSTTARYTISLREASIIRKQIQNRRVQIRRDRQEARFSGEETDDNSSSAVLTSNASSEDDIDALDIDVPGWEEKGRWVFYLDLATDFWKLVLYLTFFCVLCMFYGMPIHIIRDVALTIRSFYKRITDFVRYRQATRDMHDRYPDATVSEIAREDVCIICREDMRPWGDQAISDTGTEDNNRNSTVAPIEDERLRPKKLPCGHILHFACLRSWLERQQNCPTCRRPVLVSVAGIHNEDNASHDQQAQQQAQANQAQPRAMGGQQPPLAQNIFTFGPLRIAFGARQRLQTPQQQGINNTNPPTIHGSTPVVEQVPRLGNAFDVQRQALGNQNRLSRNAGPSTVHLQLHQIEQQLHREINGLRLQQNQLFLVRALQCELARLRIAQSMSEINSNNATSTTNLTENLDSTSTSQSIQLGPGFASSSQQQPMLRSHPNLPTGMTIPPGWSVLPLQRIPGSGGTSPSSAHGSSVPNPQTANDDPLTGSITAGDSGTSQRDSGPVQDTASTASKDHQQPSDFERMTESGVTSSATSAEAPLGDRTKGKKKAPTVEDTDDEKD